MDHFRIALRKSIHFYKNKYCGYLIPMEIITLIKHGAIPSESNEYFVEISLEKKKKGDCSSTWFYYTPTKEMKSIKETLNEK